MPADHTWFGHLIDDVVSNTYRALRFVNDPSYKDLLYAEFTSQPDWHYENPVHYELFNVRAHALPCRLLLWTSEAEVSAVELLCLRLLHIIFCFLHTSWLES